MIKRLSEAKLMNTRARPCESYRPTQCEHLANIASHGIAVLPSVFGWLHLMEVARSDAQWISAVVYGLFTTCLFTMSTTYHAVFLSGQYRELLVYLHMADRASIYGFIAASYTPWLMVRTFQSDAKMSFGVPFNGPAMLVIVWILAVLGIVYQIVFHEKFKILETVIYVFVAIFPCQVVVYMEDVSGVWMAAIGGLCYFIGVFFFKLDGRVPCAHAIWHTHVVIGALLQYCAIAYYLIGQPINQVAVLPEADLLNPTFPSSHQEL